MGCEIPWKQPGSSFLHSKSCLAVELGNRNIRRPSLFQSRNLGQRLCVGFQLLSLGFVVFWGFFVCVFVPVFPVVRWVHQLHAFLAADHPKYMTTSWPLGRAAFTEHLNELFLRDGMKIFSHSEGNNADLSKFPVPAELSLPGTHYSMEKSFICKN